MKNIIVFPGQGSQHIGMGKEIYDNFNSAKEVFKEVDDALSQDLSGLIFNGDIDELTLTSNAQPALMVTSLAIVRVLEKDFGLKIEELCSSVAGHSLGEYSAHCAARSLSLRNTAKLLRLRGDAMQNAVAKGEGAMAAILGLDFDTVSKIAKSVSSEEDYCDSANDNADGQTVISGHVSAVKKACEKAKEEGAKRAIILPVSAPFHSKLMKSAEKSMDEALKKINFESPVVPIIANVSAEPSNCKDKLKKMLVEQVCSRVRWRETMKYIEETSYTNLIEIGAGKVLSGLIRRNKNISSTSINNVDDIENFVNSIKN